MTTKTRLQVRLRPEGTLDSQKSMFSLIGHEACAGKVLEVRIRDNRVVVVHVLTGTVLGTVPVSQTPFVGLADLVSNVERLSVLDFTVSTGHNRPARGSMSVVIGIEKD